jgi:hypothetical protein
MIGEFVAHDSSLQFGSLNHMPDGTINPQKAVTADADTVIYFRFWGEADMAGRAALLVPVENDPERTWLGRRNRRFRQNCHSFQGLRVARFLRCVALEPQLYTASGFRLLV